MAANSYNRVLQSGHFNSLWLLKLKVAKTAAPPLERCIAVSLYLLSANAHQMRHPGTSWADVMDAFFGCGQLSPTLGKESFAEPFG